MNGPALIDVMTWHHGDSTLMLHTGDDRRSAAGRRRRACALCLLLPMNSNHNCNQRLVLLYIFPRLRVFRLEKITSLSLYYLLSYYH